MTMVRDPMEAPPPPVVKVETTPLEPLLHVVGVDLGSVNDATAITVLEVRRSWVVHNEYVYFDRNPRELSREADLHFVVRLMHRPRLGTPYPQIIDQVRAIMDDLPPLRERPMLAVDATGLGAPIVQQMRRQGLSPIGVSITAGNTATMTGRNWSVPKALLVGETRLVMHRQRLKIAQGFAARETLEAELAAFTARLSPSGRATFEAAGSEHDDTVLSLSIAVFVAKQRPAPPRVFKLEPFLFGKLIPAGEP